MHRTLRVIYFYLQAYVQNILNKNSRDVYKTIVKEGGHFYVCGDVKMASDVTATLEKIIMTEGKMTTQDAKNYILKLRVMTVVKIERKAIIRNKYNQIPILTIKTKTEEAHSQIVKFPRQTRTVNRMNSCFSSRWTFSCLKQKQQQHLLYLFSVSN